MKGFQPLGIGNGCNPYNFNFSYNFNFMGLPNVNPVQNMFQGLP